MQQFHMAMPRLEQAFGASIWPGALTVFPRTQVATYPSGKNHRLVERGMRQEQVLAKPMGMNADMAPGTPGFKLMEALTRGHSQDKDWIEKLKQLKERRGLQEFAQRQGDETREGYVPIRENLLWRRS